MSNHQKTSVQAADNRGFLTIVLSLAAAIALGRVGLMLLHALRKGCRLLLRPPPPRQPATLPALRARP